MVELNFMNKNKLQSKLELVIQLKNEKSIWEKQRIVNDFEKYQWIYNKDKISLNITKRQLKITPFIKEELVIQVRIEKSIWVK